MRAANTLGADTMAMRLAEWVRRERASVLAVASVYQNWDAFQSSVKADMESGPVGGGCSGEVVDALVLACSRSWAWVFRSA